MSQAAYLLGQMLCRTPSLGLFIGGAVCGGTALLNYFDSNRIGTGAKSTDLSQCKERSYVVLTGRLHCENYSELKERGLPGMIGDLKISKTTSNTEVVHSTFRVDATRNDPRFDNTFETNPPIETIGNKKFRGHEYRLILDSGETVFLQNMNAINIDGESFDFLRSQEIYTKFSGCHEFSKVFEEGIGRDIKYEAQYNYIPENAIVSIAGEISQIAEQNFTLSIPSDSRPYLITTKKIEDLLGEKHARTYIAGITSAVLLGMSAYMKCKS